MEFENRLLKFLLAFPKLSEEDYSYINVTGKDYDENLISNHLAFFMDMNKPHGFGSLLVDALMQLLGGEYPVQETLITREYYTNAGKRIDLVLELDQDIVIAVENKIHAGLYNPLDEYYNTLKTKFPDRKLYCCVLAPTPKECPEPWISITYKELWERTRKLLGLRLRSNNLKWLANLLSLIEHTEAMTESDITFTPQEKSIFEHYKHLDEVWGAKRSLEDKIHKFALLAYSNIETEIKKHADLDEMFRLKRAYEKYVDGCLAIDKQEKENTRSYGGECAFDFRVWVPGYELSWFYRRAEGLELFNLVCERLKNNPDIGGVFKNNRFFIFNDELDIEDIISGSPIEKYTKKVLSCLQIVKQVCDERKSTGVE